MKILITGGSGYIGTLIIQRLLREKAGHKIVSIDRNKSIDPRVETVEADLALPEWQKRADALGPFDAVIHAAFKIRFPYGKVLETEKNNLDSARNVFEFTFSRNVPRLVYLSSVAAYGARPENVGKLLKETDPLAESRSPYGLHKRLVEELLEKLVKQLRPSTRIAVLRLNSVTGPIGQNLKSKFGLITFIKKIPFLIEAHSAWARQYVHETDVAEIAAGLALASSPNLSAYEVFNISPEQILTARDMARLLNKRVLKIPAWLVRPAFALAWHLSRGRLPTHPGSAPGLIYPINTDGSKIRRVGFAYRHTGVEAFLGKNGYNHEN